MPIRRALLCAVVAAIVCASPAEPLLQGFSNVQGFVLDGEGNGIAGASVLAYHLLVGRVERIATVASGSDGHYVVNVPEGETMISVEASGYLPTMARKVQAPADSVNFRLSRLPGTSGVAPFAVGVVVVFAVLTSVGLYMRSRQTPATSPRIFVSYRRAESADVTGRIYDRLVQQFGRKHVFKDVDSIRLGVDFRVQIERELQNCQVAIVVIGDRWITEPGASGVRRLDEPNDWVRLELEAVLQRRIPIIPVLVKGALIPTERDLPSSIASLSHRAAVSVRSDPDFHHDVNRLIDGIQANLQSAQPSS